MPGIEEDYIERDIKVGPKAGKTMRIPFFPGNSFVRRVFSRGDWRLNGRFNGGWWQQIDSKLRRTIHIGGVPTIEVDFKAMHVNFISLRKGELLVGDSYDITEGYLDSVARGAQRQYPKHLVLTVINARDRGSALKAFRDSYPKNSAGFAAGQ